MVVEQRKRTSKGRFAPEVTFYTTGKFDTRLDARWAVLLDTLAIGYRYDRAEENPGEGSMLRIPRFGDFRLLVRRHTPIAADIRRAQRWVHTGIAREVVILAGKPSSKGTYSGYSWWRNSAGEFGQSGYVLWRECLWCSWLCLDTVNVACPNPDCEEFGRLSASTAQLAMAYKVARSVRLSSAGTV